MGMDFQWQEECQDPGQIGGLEEIVENVNSWFILVPTKDKSKLDQETYNDVSQEL